MPVLTERDITEISTIRRKAVRYKELNAALSSHMNNQTNMPANDYAELKRLEVSIAGDVERLLSYIDLLRGTGD